MLEIILYMILGLAVFFAGLILAEKGLVLSSGERLKKVLKMFTSNVVSAMITGTIVTAIVQSSSAVSVITIGFVSSGVMTLAQAMGVILGANIGTTVTMHILALNIHSLEWILCLGGLLIMILSIFAKKPVWRYTGIAVFGFGLIFFGLSIMEWGVAPLQYNQGAVDMLARFGAEPLLAIFAGTLFTGVIQSSGVTSGIVLVMVREGMMNLMGGIGIILGANIGTCGTALLASIKANRVARCVAYFHVIYNILGVLMFIPMMQGFCLLISTLGTDLGRQIAIAQTIFNVVTAVLTIPLLKPLERLLNPQA